MDVGSMPINASSTAASRSGEASMWIGAQNKTMNVNYGFGGISDIPSWAWIAAAAAAWMWFKKKG